MDARSSAICRKRELIVSQFEYVAVLVSIIVGLALTQLLRGVGAMVVDTRSSKPYWVHLMWTFNFFANITLFWWWEFRLVETEWNIALYVILIVYATLFFFASLVLQPRVLPEGLDYKEYYYSRRTWIFGLLAATLLWDFVDTAAKGIDHFIALEKELAWIQLPQLAGYVVAMYSANERFHAIFSVIWLLMFGTFVFRASFVI